MILISKLLLKLWKWNQLQKEEHSILTTCNLETLFFLLLYSITFNNRITPLLYLRSICSENTDSTNTHTCNMLSAKPRGLMTLFLRGERERGIKKPKKVTRCLVCWYIIHVECFIGQVQQLDAYAHTHVHYTWCFQ